MAEKKNLCAQLDIGLHRKITEAKEQAGLTTAEYDEETLEGYVELMVEVCCSRRDFIRIAGEEMAAGVVKSRFLKLNHEHIAYVLDSLSQNTTLVKNIKAYTLAALYNAPTTISQYYASLVSHDLAQDAAGI